MPDWKEILSQLYVPETGSLWVASNKIWNNSFASNKDRNDCHPAVVGRIFADNIRCQIIPGTTKEYQKGSCVFRVKLNPYDSDCPFSNFLIKYWMTYSINDLLKLKRGWNGIESLNENQIEELKLQIKFCIG